MAAAVGYESVAMVGVKRTGEWHFRKYFENHANGAGHKTRGMQIDKEEIRPANVMASKINKWKCSNKPISFPIP